MVTVPLWGFIRPKSGDDFKLEHPELQGDHLTFTTQEVQGISYDFDGRFLAPGNFPETPPEGVVLKGRLRIEMESGAVDLAEGEMFVVPKGVRHNPVAEHECHLLLIERKSTRHTGDVVTRQTRSIDDQLRPV